MASIGLTALGLLLIFVGSVAAWRPETAIEIQRTSGPGLFADRDEEFVEDMIAATPYVGGALAWIGAGVAVYGIFF